MLALLLVKPAWGLGGGILTLLAVFGERFSRLAKAQPPASEFFRSAGNRNGCRADRGPSHLQAKGRNACRFQSA